MCSQLPNEVLKSISIIDSPGILSGEKQRISRGQLQSFIVTKLTKFFLLDWTNQQPDLWGALGFLVVLCGGLSHTSILQALYSPCLRLYVSFGIFSLESWWGLVFCHPAAMAANGYSCMVIWLISALSLLRKSLVFIILIAFHVVIMTLIYYWSSWMKKYFIIAVG